MRKKLVWIVSIITIIIGIVLIIRSRDKEQVYQLTEVGVGDVAQIVSVTGTVTSAKEVDLQFENVGKIKEIAVGVGDKVSTGDILIKLDTAELNAQFISSQASLAVAEAQLAQTITGDRPEDIQVYETDVINAEIDLENKKQALIDTMEDAENDLQQDYEDVPDILNDAYNKASDAVYTQIDALFLNDNSTDPELAFDTANQQAETSAEEQREAITGEMNNFQNELISLNISDYDNLDKALNNVQNHLNEIRDLLTILMDVLNGATSLTPTVLDGYKTDVTTARTNINTVLTNVTDQKQTIATTRITNQININDDEAAVDTAEAVLKTAQDKLILKKAAPAQADVDLAEAKVKQAQADLLQVQEKLNKAVLRSPIDGFITVIDKEEGEIAKTTDIIVSVIAVEHFQIETNISETEIAKVKLNDGVTMTLDALGSQEEFAGRIIKIDPAETIVSGVIYYKATSAFDVRDERVKPGMTANLEIQTDRKTNVLFLPYYAIHETNGRQYVEILSGKEVVEKDVKTGLEGEVNVEIIEGLEAGRQVIIFNEE